MLDAELEDAILATYTLSQVYNLRLIRYIINIKKIIVPTIWARAA
jgi:hypothetical protein